MKKNKYLLGIFSVFVLVFAIFNLVKINIINTKALSPVGNTDDNKKIVNSEFGDEFKSFIQDNSNIKIYEETNGEYLVTINDNKIRIKEESSLLKGTKKVLLKVKSITNNLISNIESLFQKIVP
ncbi:hypothetical protein J2Z53_001090 [Clostridium moniliforme]|uniref:Uncharacterized protein n=1 Tax=Clostridium moniliforme TaxID=39489 RepID=A0ABS4EZT0_9CLOT|nr:hypothetical protein [Clostridium moniliforme]MBP1889509.1 hypothetical protein [Clostridium moniliforme]